MGVSPAVRTCPRVCVAESSWRRARLKIADLLAFKVLVRADPRLPPTTRPPPGDGAPGVLPRASGSTVHLQKPPSAHCLLVRAGGSGRPWGSPRRARGSSLHGRRDIRPAPSGRLCRRSADVDLDPLRPGCPLLGLLQPGAAAPSGLFCAPPRPPQHLYSLQPCSELDIAG